MSFMGLEMNPMESVMVGSSGSYGEAGSSADESHSAHDQSGTSGGADGIDYNSSNFDSGGFDDF